jgi:hypothetical protein
MYRVYFYFKNGSDKSITLKEIPNDDIEALTKRIADIMGNDYNPYFTDVYDVNHIISATELQYISVEKRNHYIP